MHRGIADYRKADVDVPANHPFATKKEVSIAALCQAFAATPACSGILLPMEASSTWKLVRHASSLCGPSATGPTVLHPQLTPEEEELLKKRLDVKRGAPVQDLSGRRGYPGQPGFEPQ